MPLLLLLLLAVTCIPDSWPAPMFLESTPLVFALITWAGVFSLGWYAHALSRRAFRTILMQPDQREHAVDRYSRGRRRHYLLSLIYFIVAVFVLGWGWTVQTWCSCIGPEAPDGTRTMIPGAELLILAPFFVSLMIGWSQYFETDRLIATMRGEDAYSLFPSRSSYVLFYMRQNLALLVVPLSLLISMRTLHRLNPGMEREWPMQAGSLGLMIAMFIGLPLILRFALGLTPMPAGPLRDRLESASRRLNFRCSNILIWNTQGTVANAMVAGIVPWMRYVLFTDRILHDMTPDELEAVFGHEVGHVKHHHMLYYLGFLMISLTAVAGVFDLVKMSVPGLDELFKTQETFAMLPMIGVVGAYIFVVFGFVSRRCERQADIYGCRAVSCSNPNCQGHDETTILSLGGHGLCPTGIRIFIDALEKVARVNGINRSKPGWLQSWQHSTIARRVEFLQHVLDDPRVEERFQRRLTAVKWAVLAGLAIVLIVLWNVAPPESSDSNHASTKSRSQAVRLDDSPAVN